MPENTNSVVKYHFKDFLNEKFLWGLPQWVGLIVFIVAALLKGGVLNAIWYGLIGLAVDYGVYRVWKSKKEKKI